LSFKQKVAGKKVAGLKAKKYRAFFPGVLKPWACQLKRWADFMWFGLFESVNH
jgi:hypothetical protein